MKFEKFLPDDKKPFSGAAAVSSFFLNKEISSSLIATNYLSFEQFEAKFKYINRFRKNAGYFGETIITKIYKDFSDEIFYDYSYIRRSSFIDFFDRRDIDVPKSFVGIYSLRRPSAELLLLKLANLLMRAGKKEKVFKLLSQTFYRFRDSLSTSFMPGKINFARWRHIYLFHSNFFLNDNHPLYFLHANFQRGRYEQFYLRNLKFGPYDYTIEKLFLKTIFILQPLFYFSVFNIDKNIKKITKKKGSKYVFVWKYVPLYKRKLTTLKLLIKDIKFNTGDKISIKFLNSLKTFNSKPKDSFAFKLNHFTNSYVLKNMKKSLLKTLKSSS